MRDDRTHEGKLLLISLAAVLTSLTWAGWLELHPPGRSRIASHRQVTHSGRGYVPVSPAAPRARTASWRQPSPRGTAGERTYDLFTPPVIRDDPAPGEFNAGMEPVTSGVEAEDFELELIGVRREPFPLQLVGFVGGEGDYLGAFENVLTAEHFLARGGRQVAGLGLSILDFKVKRIGVRPPDSMPFSELVAEAAVRDDRTGRETMVNSRERCYADTLVATFAPVGSPEERMELRPGEELTCGADRYRLQAARLSPPAADVIRQSQGLSASELKTLTPHP